MDLDTTPQLSDYAVAPGEGGAELLKALSAGQITGRETTDRTDVSGAGLKFESLERTMKVLTAQMTDLKVWNKTPKDKAFNTVEEYLQQTKYGNNQNLFVGEGELPSETDPEYVRRSSFVKYMGTVRKVTHQMQLVNQVGAPATVKETENGTMTILQGANRAILFADSRRTNFEFDGLHALHRQFVGEGVSLNTYYGDDTVIDLRGSYLKESHMQDAAKGVVDHYGVPNFYISGPNVLNDFSKEFFQYKRVGMDSSAVSNGTAGQRINTYASQFGDIPLDYDLFAGPDVERKKGAGPTTAAAPAAPTADGTTPAAAVSDAALTKFGDGAGTYFYAVAARNRKGESALTMLTATALTVGATQSVDLKFADASSGETAAESFILYRSLKNPTGASNGDNVPLYPIAIIRKAELTAGYDGAAAGLVRDRNHILGGCEQAVVGEWTTRVFEFKQLLPLMKFPLATIDIATRFAILLYGMPQLFAPRKMVRIINIGPRA
jgi:hypothetical protein